MSTPETTTPVAQVAATYNTTIAERESKAFFWKFALAYFGTCLVWAGPSQLLLANQMITVRPDRYEDALALLMMCGGATAVVTSLLVGFIADRSRLSNYSAWAKRWGKRFPWILLAVPLSSLGMLVMSFTPGYWVLVALWCLVQLFVAFMTNNLFTITADVVPQKKFGTISGILGVTYVLGLVGGTAIASLFPLNWAYIVIAGLSLGLVIQLGFGRGSIDPAVNQSTLDEQAELGAFVFGSDAGEAEKLPLSAYRNYWTVFFSRFVMHVTQYTALFYLLYYLRDHIKVDDPDTWVLILTVVFAAVTMFTAVVAGPLSDKLERRKIFIILAALTMAAATVIMTFVDAVQFVVGAAVLLGLAWGMFSSVEQALINESLPSKVNRARDVSIMTLAQGTANMMAGILAAAGLKYLGGYPGLYEACAVACVIGALLALTIRSSR
ncbi:MFS transporter [Corynebacterium aquatimens]|uniref:MFS family permease n=1 Tax=Corynebacterium aquatimens TaxID=1190508 RepID=A0A931GWR9_9CORY|nr:MFS transporter [Corynebacterium aquatimens]MBG6123016.1 MFS family permease [Corynebacterium aquatimens]WJY66650.1 Major Facilitator Superfamily protein [Corynebacterium aquatimens]